MQRLDLPQARLSLVVRAARSCALPRPRAGLATYTFKPHTIRHHICPVCGCAPFSQGVDPQGSAMAAINVRCLDRVELEALEMMQFDGRSR